MFGIVNPFPVQTHALNLSVHLIGAETGNDRIPLEVCSHMVCVMPYP